MTKKEARKIAVDFVWSVGNIVDECLHKHSIDDSGNLSESGYIGDDYEKVKKEVEFILLRVLKMGL